MRTTWSIGGDRDGSSELPPVKPSAMIAAARIIDEILAPATHTRMGSVVITADGLHLLAMAIGRIADRGLDAAIQDQTPVGGGVA